MKLHFSDWNNLMQGIAAKLGPSCDPLDADALLLYNDVRGSFKDISKTAHKLGKKVYVLQHGRAATRDYDKPNQFPLEADKFLAWGKADYDRMVKLGYGDRTEIVGCPLLSKIQPRRTHDGKYIVFIPVNTGNEEPANLKVYYELLQYKYAKAAKKSVSVIEKGKAFHQLYDVNVVAKLLPRHEKQLYHGDTFVSNPDDPRHMDFLFEILSMADVVVTLDESTSEILAMAAGVPVICVDDAFKFDHLFGADYKGVELIKTTGAYHCQLTDLPDALDKALYSDNLAEARKTVVEHELGVSAGDPVENILKAMGWK